MQMICWDTGIKLLMHLKMVLFYLNIKKKSDDAARDIVLEDVNKFPQKIESIAEKINLGFFEDFLNHHHQLIMQKHLLILRIQMKIKKLWPG